MKIGLLTGLLGENGAGVQVAVCQLARALSTVAVVQVYGGAGEGADPTFRSFSIVGPAAFGYLPGLAKSLNTEPVDLVHTHGLWMYTSVACVRWSGKRRPYLVSPHGMLDIWALRNSGWKKRFAGWIYENRHLSGAACLHALTEAEATAIREYGLRNPICIIPNGVELPAESTPIAGPQKVCVFLGRLHPKKGLPMLLRAWSRVRNQNWKLVIAGWDQNGHERGLRLLSDSLGLDESVQFVGPRFGVEKAALLKGASAFVLPSLSEGLPVAVLEAWSYGLPVVMTPECNLPEGFEARAALRAEANEDGIAGGLSALFAIGDAELRAMGSRGRRLVQDRLTWPRIAGEMMSVYEWVLGQGPRPSCVQLP